MFGLNMVVNKGRTVFIGDTTVHEYPSSEQLAEIALSAARVVRLFGFDPKVAFVSHSTFGQPVTSRTKQIRDAVEILKKKKAEGLAAKYFQITPEHILVAHDELDIPPGASRFKFDGGHGGHNGLRDIIPAIGGSKAFWRLRVGIGHPGQASKVSGWVLSRASKIEQGLIDLSIDESLSALPLLLDGEDVQAMTRLHSSDKI